MQILLDQVWPKRTFLGELSAILSNILLGNMHNTCDMDLQDQSRKRFFNHVYLCIFNFYFISQNHTRMH